MNQYFQGQGIDEAWYKALEQLYNRPDFWSSPRGLDIKECINTTIAIKFPRRRLLTHPERNLSKRYLAGELAFYLTGSRKLKFISHYSKFWYKVSDDGRTVNSCYGYKLFKKRNQSGMTQYEYARQQLINDPQTRKAVMIIYTSENAKMNLRDNPCTMYLHFFIRKKQLMLYAYMRSNDIWFGVSYDIPFFTIVQEMMWIQLRASHPEKFNDLLLGPYFHNSGSLHLYKKDFAYAKHIVDHPEETDPTKESMQHITETSLKELSMFFHLEKQLRINGSLKKGFVVKDPFIYQLCMMLEGGQI